MRTFDLVSVSGDIREVLVNAPSVVKRVGIFGSLARGTFELDSDIDILVEYDTALLMEMEHFSRFCALCNEIRDTLVSLYGRGVDIVHFDGDPFDSVDDENVRNEVVWM